MIPKMDPQILIQLGLFRRYLELDGSEIIQCCLHMRVEIRLVKQPDFSIPIQWLILVIQ